MKKEDRKKHKKKYQESHLPMGVFLIRNIINDKVFVAAGRNLLGVINRHKFQLTIGKHANKSLQADWSQLGSQNFAFEILEELDPPNDARYDQEKELAFMEKLWLEKLQPFAEGGYNEPKLSKQEKLRRMAANRLANAEG
jgi:hypothetical protein